MKNNKISKITTLASLLVAGMVNAQEFYTCVPKKDWWKTAMKESIKEQKKEEWRLIKSVDVIKNKNWKQNLFYAPIGNLKIRLLKGTELIGEHIVKNPEKSYIKSWDVDCDVENKKEYGLKNYLKYLEYDNAIILNWHTNKFQFNEVIKNKCKNTSKSFIFITLADTILFGGGHINGDYLFDEYFKGTIIEVYKKVEY